jgi:hypothetical protein
MAKDLLHASQVSAAFQQMCGGGVAQPVRPGLGHASHRG